MEQTEQQIKTSVKSILSRNFSLLVIGQFMSIFANQVLTFTLPLYLLYTTGSAALFGSVLGLSFLPFILTAPIAGIMADRFKKQKIMFWLDIAVTAVVLLYMIISGMFSTLVPIVVVKLVALNAIQGMYAPTSQACVPFLISEDKLVRANSVMETVNTLSNMAAPPAAGILLAGFGIFPILIICAVCFAITSVIDLLIKIPYTKQSINESMTYIVKSDIVEAFRFIKKRQILIKIAMLMFVLSAIVPAVYIVGVPVFLTQYLGLGTQYLGIGRGIAWGGGILGGLLSGILGKKLTLQNVPMLSMLVSLSMVPLGVAIWIDVSYFTAFVIIVVADFMCGIVLIPYSIAIWTYLQAATPPALIGKVLSLFNGLPMAAMGIGFLIYGMLFERFAATPWHVIFVSTFICCIAILLLWKYFKDITP